MTVSRSAGKIAAKILSLFLCFILTIGVSLSQQERTVNADGTVEVGISQSDVDQIIIYINSWSFDSNVSSIDVYITLNKYVEDGALSEPWGNQSNLKNYSLVNGGDQIKATVVPNTWVAICVSSTNIQDYGIALSNYNLNYSSTPTPTPESTSSPTPKPTATPTPKPTATP